MRLLVSVIDPAEISAALAGGADVVDLKDPAQGPLGAAEPATIRAARRRVAPPVELSAALGDVPHLPGTLALAAHAAAACGADFVKVGLLDPDPAAARRLLQATLRGAREAAPSARVVAVAYADADRCGALPPGLLPRIARDAAIDGVLLDTFHKDGTSSLAALGEERVGAWLAEARALGLLTALAGGLTLADLGRVRALDADLVGVRGAACEGGRGGRVCESRVREIRSALGLSAPASPGSGPAPAEPPPARGVAR